MSKRMPAGCAAALFKFFVEGDLDESRVLPTVVQITGSQPRSFEQWSRPRSRLPRAPSGAVMVGGLLARPEPYPDAAKD
jgi:hypothetical protein